MNEELMQTMEASLLKTPTLGRDVYIAKGAAVVGDVRLGDGASVWYNAVVRGDLQPITIGHYSNIQDSVVMHIGETSPCTVGDWVTVGHSAILHACTIGNTCLIGMGAVVLDDVVIGEECIIASRSLVTVGTKIPAGSMVMGTPGKVVRDLSATERAWIKTLAEKYARISQFCLQHNINVSGPMPGPMPVAAIPAAAPAVAKLPPAPEVIEVAARKKADPKAAKTSKPAKAKAAKAAKG